MGDTYKKVMKQLTPEQRRVIGISSTPRRKTDIKTKFIEQFETFQNVGMYEKSTLSQRKPSCFNGTTKVKRYRITIEEIIEPIEVYQERLQKLYDDPKTGHSDDRTSIKRTAKELGCKLKNSY